MSNVKNKKTGSIYNKNILSRMLVLKYNNIGSNIKEILLSKLKKQLEGKCSKEGYIKKNSINILKYSSGILIEDSIKYEVVFECLICNPVEGMKIKCIIKNITKAGIRCVYYKEDELPIILFIAREHNQKKELYNNLKENDIVNVKTIGIRYQLNDEYISVMGELLKKRANRPLKIQKTAQPIKKSNK